MNTNSNIIDVTLSLASPMYIAYPDNKDKNNVCLTVKKPVIDGGRPIYVPYYPSNGLRGALRRKAASRVAGRLCAGDARIPEHLYIGLNCGASSGSPDETPLSIEEILRAKRNVYMGLFGGAARMLQSAYRVSDINPIIDLTVRGGVVPRWCADKVVPLAPKESGGPNTYLSAWEVTNGIIHMFRVDDLYRVKRADEISRFVANPVESVAAHQDAVMHNKNARKEGTAKKEDVANMFAIETIATGTPMHFHIMLDPDVTEAQMGLMLYSLSDLLRENSFGGHCRQDLGRVRVDSIKIMLGDALGGEEVSGVDLGQGAEFRLPSSETITRLLAAADENIAALTMDEMLGYFTDFSAPAKEARKVKAAARKAAKNADEVEG